MCLSFVVLSFCFSKVPICKLPLESILVYFVIPGVLTHPSFNQLWLHILSACKTADGNDAVAYLSSNAHRLQAPEIQGIIAYT